MAEPVTQTTMRPETAIRVRRAQEMAAWGHDRSVIAERFSVSETRVSQWLQPTRTKKRVQEAWTDAETAMASKLWLAGKSAAAIAKKLGPPRTRGSVLGRLNRMGLVPRPRALLRGRA